jgi:hypothetical protein
MRQHAVDGCPLSCNPLPAAQGRSSPHGSSPGVTRWNIWCWLDSTSDLSCTNDAPAHCVDADHQPTDRAVGAPSPLRAARPQVYASPRRRACRCRSCHPSECSSARRRVPSRGNPALPATRHDGGVGDRVQQLQPVQPPVLQRPAGQRSRRLGRDASAPGGRHHPVRTLGPAARKADLAHGDPPEDLVGVAVGDRPATIGLCLPPLRPLRDPRLRLVDGGEGLQVPPLDGRVGVGVHRLLGVSGTPGPQRQLACGPEDRLLAFSDATSWHDGRHKLGHVPIMPDQAVGRRRKGGCKLIERADQAAQDVTA